MIHQDQNLDAEDQFRPPVWQAFEPGQTPKLPATPIDPVKHDQSDTDRVLKAFFDLRGSGTNPRKAAALAAMLPIESEVAA